MSQGMEQSVRAEPRRGGRASGRGDVAVRNFGDLVAGGDLGVESPSGYRETDADIRGV